ncbi:MAG TPA: hypothetical protein VHO48_07130 [Anaerolineaceae bacterium]|nr:hypothetical protein [Anaerolineaceae bacterium]
MKKRTSSGWVILAIVLITGIPYLVAYLSAGSEMVFGGFLLNPIDGSSYLAKMYQGWEGSWKFTLPYTAQPGDGGYLFLFYLFLGQLARWFGISLGLTFHIARILGSIALGLALFRFFQSIFPDDRDQKRAYFLAFIGSGSGWLAFLFGQMPADFWVAEAFPILSSYANPHFPFSLALILTILTIQPARLLERKTIWVALASLALSTLLPFGVVVSLVVLCGTGLWTYLEERRLEWVKPVTVAAAGAPMMIYQLALTLQDPVIAGWNAQNLTPSPALWDLIVATSPAFLLALIGLKPALQRNDRATRMLLVWAVGGMILLYVPFSLQRRFMLGFYIPLAALAIIGLNELVKDKARWSRLGFAGLVILSVPTTMVVLLAGFSGMIMRDPMIYLTRGEAQALTWVQQNTPGDALIIAGPETGLLIPAYSGRRVIYGHPYETVDAKTREGEVDEFFADGWSRSRGEYLQDERIDYVWVGPREKTLGSVAVPGEYPVVYQANDVTIYQVAANDGSGS